AEPGEQSIRLPPPDRTGTVLVEGLRAGAHDVVVRHDWSLNDERDTVYGRGEVTIVAGTQGSLTLDIPPDGPRPTGGVTGTLTIGQGWNVVPRKVLVREIESGFQKSGLLRRGLSGRIATFEIGGVPEGRCDVEVPPLHWHKEVVVGPGATHVEFEVPSAV